VEGTPGALVQWQPSDSQSDDLPLTRRNTAQFTVISLSSTTLEVEGCDDRGVVGLGIFPVDSEGSGLVVQDLVVDF
jgi:hypothetical protein